jgi:hypothetical protein
VASATEGFNAFGSVVSGSGFRQAAFNFVLGKLFLRVEVSAAGLTPELVSVGTGEAASDLVGLIVAAERAVYGHRAAACPELWA